MGSLLEAGGAFFFSSFMNEVALFWIVLIYEPMFGWKEHLQELYKRDKKGDYLCECRWSDRRGDIERRR